MSKIPVLLVDDHTLFRSGLRLLLGRDVGIEVVGEAGTGSEALELAQALQPQVVLLDLTLPDISGIALLKRFAVDVPLARVVVLTMHNDAALVRAALAAGARGYLVKSAADTELSMAVRAVANGRTFVDLNLNQEQLGTLLENYPAPATGKPVEPLERLTKREREVFGFLAEGHTNQAIAALLDVSVKSVETYRARIGEKLGLRTRPELIRFAIETGALTPKTRGL